MLDTPSTISLDPAALFEMEMNVFWLDQNARYLGCNQRVLELLGISEDKILGKNNDELVRDNIIDRPLKQHIDYETELVLKTKKPRINILDPVVIHANGKPVHYVTHRFPLLNSQGNINGILGITVDVTEKHLLKQSGLFGYVIMAANSNQRKKYLNDLIIKQQTNESNPKISPKEAKCLYYLLKGYCAREIGELMFISTRTVEGHFARIKQKLNCNTRAEMVDCVLNNINLIYTITSSSKK